MNKQLMHPVVPAPESIKPILRLVLAQMDFDKELAQYICHNVGPYTNTPYAPEVIDGATEAMDFIADSLGNCCSFGGWVSHIKCKKNLSHQEDNVHRKEWLEWLVAA